MVNPKDSNNRAEMDISARPSQHIMMNEHKT